MSNYLSASTTRLRESRRIIAVCLIALMLGMLAPPLALVAQGEPSLEIVSPAAGEVVTANEIAVTVAVENFTLDCAKSGLPAEPSVGHLHVMIDGMTMANLVNFYCEEAFTISLT